MTDLYYLAFRDITRDDQAVLAGEMYVQSGVTAALDDWPPIVLDGSNWAPWDQVRPQFRGKRVCFLVHGFNVSVDAGVWSEGPAAQAYANLGQAGLTISSYDIVVSVLWAGDGLIGFSYISAFGQAATTAKNFATFLLSSAVEAAEVSFISHSLGARVVLLTVAQTVAQAGGLKALPFRFDTAVLTAAAIDDVSLDSEFSAAIPALRRIVILSSMTDHVLSLWFTLGDLFEAGLWSDYAGNGRALGRYGPAFTATSSAPGITEWYEVEQPQDHSDYFPAATAGDLLNPVNLTGWSDKRVNVATFCSATLNGRPYADQLKGWANDKTVRFRPDWTPKL